MREKKLFSHTRLSDTVRLKILKYIVLTKK